MNVMDILRSYADRPTDADQDFDDVSSNPQQRALALAQIARRMNG